MPIFSRYLDLLATAQFYRSERGTYFTDRDAFFFSGRVIALIPMLHAVVVVTAIEALAFTFRFAHPVPWAIRLIACAPFLAVSIWLGLNTAYVQALRTKIRADQPDAAVRRHRESRYFVGGSYILGVASFIYLAMLQALRHGT